MRLPPFEQLITAHGADVHRYLVAGVGPVDADDCFQEVMVTALRAYPSLRHADNLRGWLFRVAYTSAIDAHRARARRAVPVAEPAGGGADAAPALSRGSSRGSSRAAAPESEPDHGLGDDELWLAVRELPPQQRAAVLHRFLHDLTYRDIGVVIGCSEAAARQNVRAGLAQLRTKVPGPGEDTP